MIPRVDKFNQFNVQGIWTGKGKVGVVPDFRNKGPPSHWEIIDLIEILALIDSHLKLHACDKKGAFKYKCHYFYKNRKCWRLLLRLTNHGTNVLFRWHMLIDKGWKLVCPDTGLHTLTRVSTSQHKEALFGEKNLFKRVLRQDARAQFSFYPPATT